MLGADEMYLPGTSKWVTGTIRRRPVHCYLYSNALVVISMDKKVSLIMSLGLNYWLGLGPKLALHHKNCSES